MVSLCPTIMPMVYQAETMLIYWCRIVSSPTSNPTVLNSLFYLYARFFTIQNAGIVPDGLSHDVYISGHSFTSIDNIWFPSQYGNNLKSRARTIYVQDVYNRQDQGRYTASSLIVFEKWLNISIQSSRYSIRRSAHRPRRSVRRQRSCWKFLRVCR